VLGENKLPWKIPAQAKLERGTLRLFSVLKFFFSTEVALEIAND
jgi:hypothetical protein